MPKLTPQRLPAYRRHKQSGRGIVTLSGKDHLLPAKYNSQQSRHAYDRLVAEWITNGRQPMEPLRNADAASVSTEILTVTSVIAAFWRHCKRYYLRPDGTPTSELENVRRALRPVKRLYGDTPATEFGPLALRAVREEMIRMGWARTSINRQIGRVRHAFRWAVSHQMIPATIVQALETVEGLRYGRTQARETEPVKPVEAVHWRAVLPHVSRQVAALIELQAITGMRPTEALTMRGRDIDTSGNDLWLYQPPEHKNRHRGQARVVYLGPRAREIVQQFLSLDPDRYLFRPCDAEAERHEQRRQARQTPVSCGNAPGTNCKLRPRKTAGERYDKASYLRAIWYGCDRAFPLPADLARKRVPGRGRKAGAARLETEAEWKQRLGKRWADVLEWRKQHRFHPHQLRHHAATEFRKRYGIEAAQVILGHKTLRMTELYAEQNIEAAKRIMSQTG